MPILSVKGNVLSEVSGKTDHWGQIYKRTSSTFYTSNDAYFQNNVLRTKKFGRNNKDVLL